MFISATHRADDMWWPLGPYGTMITIILLSTLPLRNLLTRDEPDKRVLISELPAEIRANGYYWHISLYFLMFLYKFLIDQHNEPIKARVGDYTHWLYNIEGELTLWVQETFRNDLLTDALSFHYLFVYLFIIFFSPLYFILVRDHTMADKAALNYLVIYLLAVPLYLFFNVEVTSTYIPGMDALLYHDSWYLEFVTINDPLDNGIPSLHFGLPVGLLLLNRMHCRDKGISISEWRHREFDQFVMFNLVVYFFSIQYLGIHWITDIIPGVILAVICSQFIHKWQPAIRSRPINGWNSLIPKKKSMTFAVAFTIVCTSALALVAVDGPGSDENTPNLRLGPGDVKIDIIEVHSLWDPVGVEIRNLGEHSVHAIILHRNLVVEHVDRGTVDWESIVSSQTPDETQDIFIGPGMIWQTEVFTPSVFDTHLILVKPAFEEEISEVRVTMYYVDDELIWSAMLLSMPAFLIGGLVMAQVIISENEVSEQASDEES